MNAREENIAVIAVTLSQHSSEPRLPLVFARDAGQLQSIARQLHRFDELACSEEWVGNDTRRKEELRSLRLANKAILIAQRYGLRVYLQGDPRGWPLYLFDPATLDGHDIEQVYPSQALGISPQ